MWKTLILVSQLALSVKSAPTSRSTSSCPSEMTQTIHDNLEFYAQYAGAAYCSNVGNGTASTPITCASDVCPEATADKAYNFANFHDNRTDQAGFVAIDPAKKLTVVGFRGTKADSEQDWTDDFKFTQVSCTFGSGCNVHDGFYGNWLAVKDDVVKYVTAAKAQFPNNSLVMTGHSLGAAVSTIAGAYLRDAGFPCDIYTYGSPRVFNIAGANYVNAQSGCEYRVTHYNDPVPRLPPLGGIMNLIGEEYAHTSPEFWLASGSNLNNTYPASSIQVCSGIQNENCNGQYPDADIFSTYESHRHYFGNISACH